MIRSASQGQGLGNQFLAHIRETDAICQVVRMFADPDVTPPGTATSHLSRAIPHPPPPGTRAVAAEQR